MYRTASEHNIVHRIHLGVWSTSIDELPMHSTLFLDKNLSNLTRCLQMSGKVVSIRPNGQWFRREFPMLFRGEIDRKLKLTANSNEAAGEVCTRDGGTIPQTNGRRDMHLIFPHTPPSFFPFSRLMVRTISLAKSIGR